MKPHVTFEKFMDTRGKRIRGYVVSVDGVPVTKITKHDYGRHNNKPNRFYIVRSWGRCLFVAHLSPIGWTDVAELKFKHLNDAKAKCREHAQNLTNGLTTERQREEARTRNAA